MATPKLLLNVGDTLQLQFATDETGRRHASRVIGYLAPVSLVVTTPRLDGRVLLTREGQPLVVRMLSGNNVYAFNTKITCVCMKPYPYLHLGYPDELEQIVVRKALRASTNLIVTAYRQREDDGTDQDQGVAGVIVDLSTSGALLKTRERAADVGSLITVTTRVPIANVQEYLKLGAIVRNEREEPDQDGTNAFYYGLEFQLLDQHEIIVIHGYVYEQLLNHTMG